jgi:hypothetical protein
MSNISCLFLIDSTGSMGWVHRTLRERLAMMVNLFDQEGVRVDFGIAAFRDALAEPNSAWAPLGFGADIPRQERFLHSLIPEGGGNNRGESSIYALVRGMEDIAWPTDSRRRVIALFTDDRGHIPDERIDSWDELSHKLTANNIEQIHLFVTERKVAWYDPLSMTPDCLIVRHPLSKDLNQLEESIRDFVKTTSVDILDDSSPLLDRTGTNPFEEIDEYEPESELSMDVFSDMEEDENIFDDDDIFDDIDGGEVAPVVAERTKDTRMPREKPSELAKQGTSTATTQQKEESRKVLPEADFDFDWD